MHIARYCGIRQFKCVTYRNFTIFNRCTLKDTLKIFCQIYHFYTSRFIFQVQFRSGDIKKSLETAKAVIDLQPDGHAHVLAGIIAFKNDVSKSQDGKRLKVTKVSIFFTRLITTGRNDFGPSFASCLTQNF